METRHILLGFEPDSKDFIDKIERLLEKDNFEVTTITTRNSKTGVKAYIESNPSCDTLILREVVDRNTQYGTEDLRYILDDLPINRIINVIYLCDQKYKGTDMMKEIYALGVMSTLFYNVTTWDIVQLIERPRSKKSARIYYGIETGLVISNILTSQQINDRLRHLLDGSEIELGKRYLDCVVGMNRDQNIQFIKNLRILNPDLVQKLISTQEFDIAKKAIANAKENENVVIVLKNETLSKINRVSKKSKIKKNKKAELSKGKKANKKPGIFARLFSRKTRDYDLYDEPERDYGMNSYEFEFDDNDEDIVDPIRDKSIIQEEIYAAVDVDLVNDCLNEKNNTVNNMKNRMSERRVIYEERYQNSSNEESNQITCKNLLQCI